MSNNSIRVGWDKERKVTADLFSPAAYQVLGVPLAHLSAILTFDNASLVNVEVSVDGVNTWKTFVAGEAMVLDLRANSGQAGAFFPDVNTQFYIRAPSAGAVANFFSLAINYARGTNKDFS